VISRHLLRRGGQPLAVATCPVAALSGDARTMYAAALNAGVAIVEAFDDDGWPRVTTALETAVWVVDALLGTGIRGGARGWAATVIERVRDRGIRVAAVDLPSGLDADRPQIPGACLPATRTYTLCRPKIPLVFDPAAALAGRWEVVPIGIPDEAVAAEGVGLEWIDAARATSLLPRRPREGHKGTFGHLLLVAGSVGKAGAAVLAGRGALRGGVGLVTVAVPASVRPEVAVQQADWMTEALDEHAGALSRAATSRVLELCRERQALAMGPGLGRSPGTRAAVAAILAGRTVPLVLDADGLAALAAGPAPAPPLVITPHPGEAARLLDITSGDVQADRPAAARELARRYGATVLLKGRRTLTAAPDGRMSVNSSGNPGMGTGGTGDVLTGLLGAMLCRGLDGYDAARLAAFVHGDAGDRVAAELGEDGLIASDVAGAVALSLRDLSVAANDGDRQ
jgi:NAD(P)H-hydrate epimerase